MTTIGVVVGSTRPGRKALAVAEWVCEIASKRGDATFELVDVLDYQLPILDEPAPAAYDRYTRSHTRAWAAKIASFDGFVFVTPEYNHSTSAALKNAIDYLYKEWNNKSVGFVSYGSAGGLRAVEHLRLIAAELQLADVRAQVSLSLFTEFKDFETFSRGSHLVEPLNTMLDQVIAWSTALAPLRAPRTVAPEPAESARVVTTAAHAT
jgi:NAD(P)H-dependent FMN reductase